MQTINKLMLGDNLEHAHDNLIALTLYGHEATKDMEDSCGRRVAIGC